MAMDAHRFSEYILNNKGSYFPSLEEMRRVADQADNVANVKEHIKEIEKQHCDDLEQLYRAQGEDYLNEAMDRYLAKDDLQYLVQGENNPTSVSSYAKLDSLFKDTRKDYVYTHEWDDQLYRLRTAHLKQLLPLQRLLATLETQDGEVRRRLDAEFPRTAQEYRTMRNKDVRLRVARFLATKDVHIQETMMGEYGWAWRQVQPLQDEYERDVEFKVEIESILEPIRDPRRVR